MIAAEVTDQVVRGADLAAQGIRHAAQILVAGIATQAGVDRAEIVEVDHRHHRAHVAGPIGGQCCAQQLQQVLPVGQVGDGVVPRGMEPKFLGAAGFGDVADVQQSGVGAVPEVMVLVANSAQR